MKRLLFSFSLIIALIFCFIVRCSKDDGGITEPGPVETSMTGSVTFPADALVDVSDIIVGFGEHEVEPDTNGAFSITGNQGVPGLAIAYDQDTIPMLMCIVPDPNEDETMELNVHSTALSLAFLSPFVCVTEPDYVEAVLLQLESLSEFWDFENILDEKMSFDLNVLSTGDSDIETSYNRLIVAYLNLYSSLPPKLGSGKENIVQDDIVIDPGNIVGGHQIVHIDGNNFKISNWYGRWAYCITPNEKFYIFPNGDLLDAIKWVQPWAPSERQFVLEVLPNEDPKEVNVYGLGWSDEEDNFWTNLSPTEQNYAINAGLTTILIEFVPRVLSIVTNTSSSIGRSTIAESKINKLLGIVFNNYKIIEKTRKYIDAEDPFGLSWELTKEFLAAIVNDSEFRSAFGAVVGIHLSAGLLKKVASYLNVYAWTFVMGDDLTGIAKTILGFISSRFKTTFEISKEKIEWGNVTGSVHDEDTGLPIQGVRVELKGDEDNPMNPSHVEITDATGGFWFENIMVGKKTLEVSKIEYGSKTVDIEVEKDKTTRVTIKLSKGKGTVTGKVVNEILLENGVSPPNFSKDCHLEINEIGGNNQSYSFWIFAIDNGTYSKELTPGTYELTAWHEDYEEAIITVSVAGKTVTQVDDLILSPKGYMKGDIYILTGTGKSSSFGIQRSYEMQRKFEAEFLGGGQYIDEDNTCENFNPRTIIWVEGFEGSISSFDDIQIGINPQAAKGMVDLGDWFSVSCPESGYNAGVFYATNKERCYAEDVDWYGMEYWFREDPYEAPCNCGINKSGSLILDEFGTALTDVIQGKIICDLAGSSSCNCYCCIDADGDGEEDDWAVECAKVQLQIEFKLLMGSLYNVMPEENIFTRR